MSAGGGTMKSEVRELHAKNRRGDGGAGFFVERVRSMSRAERRALVRRAHPELSVSRQCRLLSVGRSSLYYTTRGESEETLALMRRIDALFLKHPFYGARQMVRHLRREGVRIGRRRAGRLMRLLGLQAIYRAPRLSAPHPAQPGLPVSAQGVHDRAGEPGLVRRHHLHPSALRVPVPRSDHGLGEPACAGLAAVEHPRRGLLASKPGAMNAARPGRRLATRA